MIQPTVGRVVWFYSRKPGDGDQPQAATITFVHSDTMVNLTVHTPDGRTAPMTSVCLIQDDSKDFQDGPYCTWMPYQKGQAAKTEQLERVQEAAKRGFHP